VSAVSGKIVCLAISGASGFQYGLRLLECLLEKEVFVHLLVSDAAREVARLECDLLLPPDPFQQKDFFLRVTGKTEGKLFCYSKDDWLSPVASGSARMDAMVVCPCSTGTLSAIANGKSDSLMERAATVFLKEGRRMVLVPREMPMSAIQFQQMHTLSIMGVRVMPASPGFYHKPKTVEDMVDFVVARILQQLDLPHSLMREWGSDDQGSENEPV
jgi:4-hydroxy-3-polyprenylbenzoate decarboxylase